MAGIEVQDTFQKQKSESPPLDLHKLPGVTYESCHGLARNHTLQDISLLPLAWLGSAKPYASPYPLGHRIGSECPEIHQNVLFVHSPCIPYKGQDLRFSAFPVGQLGKFLRLRDCQYVASYGGDGDC